MARGEDEGVAENISLRSSLAQLDAEDIIAEPSSDTTLDMPKMYNEGVSSIMEKKLFKKKRRVVERITEKHLRKLKEDWVPASKKTHNVFMEAIAPELIQPSRDCRSLESKLGFALEHIINDLLREKYKNDTPRVLLSHSLTEEDKECLSKLDPEVGSNKNIICSRYNEEAIYLAADRLVMFSKNTSKIGTEVFRKELIREMELIASQELSSRPWSVEVDATCLTKDIGIVEIKTGGNLDESKASGDVKKLIVKYLAYGDKDLPIYFATCYANNGKDKNGEYKKISGSLKKHFEHNKSPGSMGGLLIGKHWWERILPPEISYEEFEKIFSKVAKKHEIKPS